MFQIIIHLTMQQVAQQNSAGDCEEILSNEVLNIDIDWNFNANGIKQFLLRHITIEPIED